MKDFSGSIIIIDPMHVSKENDWIESRGFNISKNKISGDLGFSSYYMFETGVGPVNMTMHKIENIKEFFQSQKDYLKSCINDAYKGEIKNSIGCLSSDSGHLCIFLKEEVEKYNPDWNKSAAHMEIDFRGRIGLYTDSYKMSHLYGIGNLNFYTI